MTDQVGKAGPDPGDPVFGGKPGPSGKPAAAEGTGVTGVSTAPGTATEVAAQGFAGVKAQADGQATAGAKGGDVPLFSNAVVSPYRDGKAAKVVVPAGVVATVATTKVEERKPHVVKDAKFTAGGEQFKAGETIYLTDDEAARWEKHLVP